MKANNDCSDSNAVYFKIMRIQCKLIAFEDGASGYAVFPDAEYRSCMHQREYHSIEAAGKKRIVE